ncbi:MAG: hypothetical protein R2706_03315 [Acidimicrobiales bacterium]
MTRAKSAPGRVTAASEPQPTPAPARPRRPFLTFIVWLMVGLLILSVVGTAIAIITGS